MNLEVYHNPFEDHSREFGNNLYTYPVISRRSRGLSLGINLSLRKECNFDCPYCQVDREHILEKEKTVNLKILHKELEGLIQLYESGEIWKHPRFIHTSPEYRILQDISISGEGESTTSKFFLEVADFVIEFVSAYQKKGFSFVPVVITNASTLSKEEIQVRLLKMKKLGGGPWIKLDASNEAEFQKVAESKIPYNKILENIISYGKLTPSIFQTIQFYFPDRNLSFQVDSMISRLLDLKAKGVLFDYIQLYTLARGTKVQGLQALSEKELTQNAKLIRKETEIEVKVYP